MTPAEPDQGVPSTARARLKAAALGVVGALLVPLPAAAAPAPCEQALRYAAQSGTELIRIGSLDLGPAGRTDKPIKNVGVGDAKSALVAQSPINAAALARVLDGGPANRKALAEVLQQTAPPTHKKPERRKHEATEVGPFSLGASELRVHAQWEPGMACGNTAGEATRAEAGLRRAGVVADGDAALVRVPGKISGLSTTAMERRGPAARAVAAASMAGGKIEVLGGAVVVKIVKPPSLLATMSGTDGGEVRYKPAVIEVSGEGFETARLDAAGDNVELRLDESGNPVPGQDGAAAGGMGRNGTGRSDTSQDGAAQDGATQDGTAQDGTGRSGATQAGASKNNTPPNGTSASGAGKNNAPPNGASTSGVSQAGGGKNNAPQADSASRVGAGKNTTSQDGASDSGAGQVGGAEDGTGGSNASRGGAAKSHTGQGAATGTTAQTGAPSTNGDAIQAGESKGGEGRNAKGNSSTGMDAKRGAGTEKASNDKSRKPGAPDTNVDNDGTTPSDGHDALFGGLPEIGTIGSATPIPLPTLPGVPPLAGPRTAPGTEAAPVATPGTTVKISLGGVRQAVSGHAIAAKATAMNIAIIKGPDRQTYGHSAPNRSGVILDLDMGLLEVAAVAPEPAGGAANAVAGTSAGLPITGPRVDVLALAGVALLIAGAAALVLGLRGRSRS